MPRSSARKKQYRVFVSHASDDSEVGKYVASVVEVSVPDATTFVSSRPGDIPPAKEWDRAIKRQLEIADAYLILLSPNSVEREWVLFETGAGWLGHCCLGRPLAIGLIGGIWIDEVPDPLRLLQLKHLDSEAEAEEVFEALGGRLSDAARFCARVRELFERAQRRPPGWEGVDHDGSYFAWKGPNLRSLDDRNPVPEPPGLVEKIRERGLEPGYGLMRYLAGKLKSGRLQVFETDTRSWKRAVTAGGNTVLIVAPPGSEPDDGGVQVAVLG